MGLTGDGRTDNATPISNHPHREKIIALRTRRNLSSSAIYQLNIFKSQDTEAIFYKNTEPFKTVLS